MSKIEIIRSNRKTIAIEIKSDRKIVVRAPMRMSEKDIQRFIIEKQSWIKKHLAIISTCERDKLPVFTKEEIQKLADKALKDIPQRVKKYASVIGVTVGKITIRNQKSRWGSCSSKGNLNFNCLLMLCPEEVRDYVVVHELCHRRELNHSKAFWEQVEKVMPNYKEPYLWLKRNGSEIIRRLEK